MESPGTPRFMIQHQNYPECKAIPKEALERAFVESFRIITDEHKDVLEEFLQRTEEELH